MKFIRIAKVALISLGLLITSVQAHAINRLEIDNYSYLSDSTWGVARTEVITEKTGYFRAYYPYPSSPDYEQTIGISFDSYVFLDRWITLSFSSGKNTQLEPGVYEYAARFPFNEPNPGLDFSDTGAGFNSIEGRFEIFEIEKDATGRFTSFIASFEISEFPFPYGQPVLGGRIWYSASTVPEPESIAMLFAGLGLLGVAVRRNK